MMNLFEEAIEKNQLMEFALGKGKYFVADRDYGDHSVITSWTNFIIPLFQSKPKQYVNDGIKTMFKNLIFSNIMDDSLMEGLLYQLHSYYYLINEKRVEVIDLTEINYEAENKLNFFISELDKRNDPKASAVRNAVGIIKSRGGLRT